MKLMLTSKTIVNGVQRRFGEVLEVADWRLADALLHSGSAVPADPAERELWREAQPQPLGWIEWRW